jgi:glycosyltransferase involved in cell wall biosynthesis
VPPRVAVLSSVHEALDPRIFHKQARTLAAAGFEVHLVARHERDETQDGVIVHALPQPRSRWARPRQWVRLARVALRLRPDVVHTHDPELLPLLLLLRRLTGAAAVYDAHEYYGDEVARRRWIPGPLRLPAARLTDRVEAFVARRIDAVVAVNEHMAGRFRRRGARAIAVHNFPPAEYFGLDADAGSQEAAPQVGAVHPVAAYVGLLSPDRGLTTVYEAARLLRRRLPEARVRVIGRIDWSGLPDSVPRDPAAWAAAGVDLAGTIPAAAVPSALTAIDAGWIPFRDTANNRRTIPLKLLEYMAAGRPVVASDIGFIGRIVRESGCGLLVPPEDAGAHADALAELLTDRERAQRLGHAGREAVRRRYTWAPEGERLVALYREVTAGRGGAHGGAAVRNRLAAAGQGTGVRRRRRAGC